MIYYILLFCILIFQISNHNWNKVVKQWYSPTALYAILWGLVWLINALNFLEYKQISDFALTLSLLPLISIFLGETFALSRTSIHEEKQYIKYHINKKKLKKIALFLSIIGLFSGLANLFGSFLVFGPALFNALQEVKNTRYLEGNDLLAGTLPGILYKYNLILQGASGAGVIASYIYLKYFNRNFYSGIIISILGSLFYDLSLGTRTFTFITASLLFFMFFASNSGKILKHNKLKKIKIFKAKTIIFIVILVLSFMTINSIGTKTRNQKNVEVGNFEIPFSLLQFLDYNAAPIICFDETINENGILYGRMSFFGIEQWLRLLRILPKNINPPKEISEWGETYVPIQPDDSYKRSYNTFTWLRYLYVDFGFLGLIIIPFLIGFYSTKSVREWIYLNNITGLFMYILLNLIIIRSLNEMVFTNDYYIFTIILLVMTGFYSSKKRTIGK